MAKTKKNDMMGNIEALINEMLDPDKMQLLTPEDFMKKRDTVKIAMEFQKLKQGIDEDSSAGRMFDDPEEF